MKNTLTIATYNIQFSQHPEKIIENLQTIVDNGASILCLQEVYIKKNHDIVQQILNKLGKSWDAISHLGCDESVLSMGNCILWNKKKFHLLNTALIYFLKVNFSHYTKRCFHS